MSTVISEALESLKNLNEETISKKVIKEDKEQEIIIPEPFDKYYDAHFSDSEDDYQPGEEIDGYGCHFIAFLDPKPEYENFIDIYPILTDDPHYPVVELAGERLFPVSIEDIESSPKFNYDDDNDWEDEWPDAEDDKFGEEN